MGNHLFVFFVVVDVSFAVNSCLNRSFFTFITGIPDLQSNYVHAIYMQSDYKVSVAFVLHLFRHSQQVASTVSCRHHLKLPVRSLQLFYYYDLCTLFHMYSALITADSKTALFTY